jgi:hypothetical protein
MDVGRKDRIDLLQDITTAPFDTSQVWLMSPLPSGERLALARFQALRTATGASEPCMRAILAPAALKSMRRDPDCKGKHSFLYGSLP